MAAINPFVDDVSLQDTRILPAGVARMPERDIVMFVPAPVVTTPMAITVVPSHSLQTILSALVLVICTEDDAYQVPTDPWAIVGPVK